VAPRASATPPPAVSSPEAPTAPATAGQAGPYKILFDASHAETAGNADWIISTSQPDPLGEDAAPRDEADWTGAISAWGVALQQTGRYSLLTLPRDGRISYADSANPLDLANFDAFIVPEPNSRFSADEKTAILTFVQNGGGLFMIADHIKSDRNNDGIDSLQIWNDLMSDNAVDSDDPFGFSFDVLSISSDNPRGIPESAADNPVMHGPFGDVKGSIIRAGTTATINPGHNPAVRGLLYRTGADINGTTGVFFLTSAFGQGRVAAWGDSSPIDDGSGQRNNELFDGWNDAGGSDAILALNATEWLVQGGAAASGPSPTAAPPTQPTVAAQSGEQQLVQNGGFEQGLTGWQVLVRGERTLVGSERAHTGAQAAGLCGYNNCSESLAQTIDIPASAQTVTLSYDTYITSEETSHAFDFLVVELRDPAGKTLQGVQRLSDGSPLEQWHHTTAGLNGYAGRKLVLVFAATSGKIHPTKFFIDDVSVTAQ
jgi:hypothetical protein